MHVRELPTPALVVDVDLLDANIARMGSAWPGESLRPHVKAFKSTTLARRLSDAGHRAFCAATLSEIQGMAAAGLGHDLLLANEVVDVARLRTVVDGAPDARITIAVDSPETIDVAARAGVREVVIDVDVGMPRCGCHPDDAGRLGDLARAAGLDVRGVMGYEGHLMMEREDQVAKVDAAMDLLAAAHAAVGGRVVSGGGTGTWKVNRRVTELQAGSFTLMDTQYGSIDIGFAQALGVVLTVISVDRTGGWAVADGGLKAMSTDHGDPSIDGASIWYLADEHTVFSMAGGAPLPSVGDRVVVWPSHVDPTVACHDTLWITRDDELVDRWPIDLRHW